MAVRWSRRSLLPHAAAVAAARRRLARALASSCSEGSVAIGCASWPKLAGGLARPQRNARIHSTKRLMLRGRGGCGGAALLAVTIYYRKSVRRHNRPKAGEIKGLGEVDRKSVV